MKKPAARRPPAQVKEELKAPREVNVALRDCPNYLLKGLPGYATNTLHVAVRHPELQAHGVDPKFFEDRIDGLKTGEKLRAEETTVINNRKKQMVSDARTERAVVYTLYDQLLTILDGYAKHDPALARELEGCRPRPASRKRAPKAAGTPEK